MYICVYNMHIHICVLDMLTLSTLRMSLTVHTKCLLGKMSI